MTDYLIPSLVSIETIGSREKNEQSIQPSDTSSNVGQQTEHSKVVIGKV